MFFSSSFIFLGITFLIDSLSKFFDLDYFGLNEYIFFEFGEEKISFFIFF